MSTSESFEGVSCMNCGEEELSPWEGDAAVCGVCGTVSVPNDEGERHRELCADCGATVPRRALVCLDCGLMAGRMDAPSDMDDPKWCIDCEQWHESDDRIQWDGPHSYWTYTKCPLCDSTARTRGPQIHFGDASDSAESSSDDVSSGQSSLGQFVSD